MKILIMLLSLVASGLLVGNELAVALFIHPVLYSVTDEAHVRVAKPLARRLGRSMRFWYTISRAEVRHATFDSHDFSLLSDGKCVCLQQRISKKPM
jgi:hypothetical protein